MARRGTAALHCAAHPTSAVLHREFWSLLTQRTLCILLCTRPHHRVFSLTPSHASLTAYRQATARQGGGQTLSTATTPEALPRCGRLPSHTFLLWALLPMDQWMRLWSSTAGTHAYRNSCAADFSHCSYINKHWLRWTTMGSSCCHLDLAAGRQAVNILQRVYARAAHRYRHYHWP